MIVSNILGWFASPSPTQLFPAESDDSEIMRQHKFCTENIFRWHHLLELWHDHWLPVLMWEAQMTLHPYLSLSLFFYALWPHKTSWSMQVWGSLAAFVEAANLARGFRLVFYWFSTQQVLPSWFMLVKWEKISKWIPNRHFHVYVHFQYLDINSQTLKNNNRR